MVNKLIIILMSILLLSNCNDKAKSDKDSSNSLKKDLETNSSSNCKKMYKKFNEKFALEENDSALVYINKAIECDSKNSNYQFSKVRFLIGINKYQDAINQIDELLFISNDPTLKMLKAILMIKTNNSDFIKLLNKSYIEFNQIKSLTSSNQLYKIALDNYFKGKDYSLEEIKKYKELYKEKPYENQNILALENLIKNENKENVLFKLFSIN